MAKNISNAFYTVILLTMGMQPLQKPDLPMLDSKVSFSQQYIIAGPEPLHWVLPVATKIDFQVAYI